LLIDLQVKAWQLPPRLITGAYFLNIGLSKRGADDATAGQLHGFATGTYPLLGKLDAKGCLDPVGSLSVGALPQMATPTGRAPTNSGW
jgi:hypothetical protein